MRYSIPTLLALNQKTNTLCEWTTAVKECNLLRPQGKRSALLQNLPNRATNISAYEPQYLFQVLSRVKVPHGTRPTTRYPFATPSSLRKVGFVRFLQEHSSPKHQRVTAGGKIVPMYPHNQNWNMSQNMSRESEEDYSLSTWPQANVEAQIDQALIANGIDPNNMPPRQIPNNGRVLASPIRFDQPIRANPEHRSAWDDSDSPIEESGDEASPSPARSDYPRGYHHEYASEATDSTPQAQQHTFDEQTVRPWEANDPGLIEFMRERQRQNGNGHYPDQPLNDNPLGVQIPPAQQTNQNEQHLPTTSHYVSNSVHVAEPTYGSITGPTTQPMVGPVYGPMNGLQAMAGSVYEPTTGYAYGNMNWSQDMAGTMAGHFPGPVNGPFSGYGTGYEPAYGPGHEPGPMRPPQEAGAWPPLADPSANPHWPSHLPIPQANATGLGAAPPAYASAAGPALGQVSTFSPPPPYEADSRVPALLLPLAPLHQMHRQMQSLASQWSQDSSGMANARPEGYLSGYLALERQAHFVETRLRTGRLSIADVQCLHNLLVEAQGDIQRRLQEASARIALSAETQPVAREYRMVCINIRSFLDQAIQLLRGLIYQAQFGIAMVPAQLPPPAYGQLNDYNVAPLMPSGNYAARLEESSIYATSNGSNNGGAYLPASLLEDESTNGLGEYHSSGEQETPLAVDRHLSHSDRIRASPFNFNPTGDLPDVALDLEHDGEFGLSQYQYDGRDTETSQDEAAAMDIDTAMDTGKDEAQALTGMKDKGGASYAKSESSEEWEIHLTPKPFTPASLAHSYSTIRSVSLPESLQSPSTDANFRALQLEAAEPSKPKTRADITATVRLLTTGVCGLNMGSPSLSSATVQLNAGGASGELTRTQPGTAAECVSSLMDIEEEPYTAASGHELEQRNEGTDDE